MLIWYLARSAGLAAFLCLSVATGVGAVGARRSGDPARRVVLQYIHRAAALCGIVLIGLHVATLLADSYAHVGVRGLLPLGSGYRPIAVTLGVLALYLFVAVAVSGALRSRLAGSPRAARAWRAVHVSSYVAWALSAGHFLLAGSDSAAWWGRTTLAGGVAIVAAGVSVRLGTNRPIRRRDRAPAPLPPMAAGSATGRFATDVRT